MSTTASEGTPSTRLELFGRERELRSVRDLLATHRLVTITGPGGVGKTRLAREVVGEHSGSQVAVCELSPVPDSGGVPTAVAVALGLPSLDAAAVALAGQRRLVLIDNAEHHLDAVAATTVELLAACPQVTVLVTSQEPLEVPGEQVLVLQALPVPPGDDPAAAIASPAVQLFAARARSAGAELPVGATAAPTLAAICRRLDGLPLAIELAAARARTLTPDDILRHLDARFELLTRRRDRGPARHRSLEAAIDWSYERLDPPTQRFFDRLGAFCGPFSLQAAHRVASEPGDTITATIERLDALVHRSLVSASGGSGMSSYVLPESLRLYARLRLEQAAEADVCDERCVDHYVATASDLIERAQRSWSDELFQTLVAAQLNLQDAARWCLAQDPEPQRAFTLFVPLWGLVHNGAAESLRDLGERLLARWPDPVDARWTPVAATTATAALLTGAAERASDLALQALAAAADGLGAVLAGRAAFMAAAALGDHGAALRYLDGAIAAAEAAALEPFAIELRLFHGLALERAGDVRAAATIVAGAHERARAGDSAILEVFAALSAGALAAVSGGEAAPTLRGALATAQRAGYPWGIGMSHRLLGALAVLAGDLGEAGRQLERSLATFVDVGQLAEAGGTLTWIAALLAAAGRRNAAASVLTTAPLGPAGIDLLERAHLDRLLAGVAPAAGTDLGSAVIAARAALANLEAASSTDDRDAAEAPEENSPRWVREGAVWALTYGGATVRLPDAKGLADLALLLSRPGREVAATDLMGTVVHSGDLGPVLDAPARRAYERRIIELQAELDEAEAFGDAGRAERASAELDQLVDALAAATGLGGRGRRTGDSTEKARSAVTRRIRDVIRRIGDVHPQLGEHLSGSVRTGLWCAYEPPEPVAWTVSAEGRASGPAAAPAAAG